MQDSPDRDQSTAPDILLLETARRLAQDLRALRQGTEITLDSDLEKDLGFDSLGRVELLHRVEQAFGRHLPEDTLSKATTLRDYLSALAAVDTSLVLPPEIRYAAPAPAEPAPDTASTLTQVLDWHVRTHPQRTHIILPGEGELDDTISYTELHRGAAAVAAGLLARDLQLGQAVAIMLPTGRDYFFSFFGILLAGCVPVPIYPPARPSQLEDHLRRHAGILSNAGALLLITMAEVRPLARLLASLVESLAAIVTPEELITPGGTGLYPAKAGDLALLQYTSGSTGNPKGVALTHANLLANIRAMGQATQVSSADVFVSWLPLYHDMGLIGAWLGSLYHACPLVIMSPLAFLARPERWLWAIHRYRGSLSAAPNFAYEICLRRVRDEDIAGLDLSSWRMAFNGAEPVSPDTVLGFAERFASYGLHREAIAPVYGLAECSVGLAFPPPGRGVIIDRVNREILTTAGRAEPAAADDTQALRLVACGQPLPGHQIRVVDATGRELGERREGRLEFKGPSATHGYFRNPTQSERLFHGEWLDSGDLAYLAGGDVYLTGRSKDVIIRAGRNIYPYELEQAVADIPGIRRGCVAVFGCADPASATERLVVLAETRETGTTALAALREQINAQAIALLGAPADDIVLAPPHTVPKTSSGKIRRAASRELYQQGQLDAPKRAVWWQVTRLAWTGTLPQLRRWRRAAGDTLFAAYAWTLFWLMAPLTWLIACLLPYPCWSWAASRLSARLFLRLCGAQLRVDGLENLPRNRPCVLVANHASYLDGIVLVAALPHLYRFIAKRELLDKFIPRRYLNSLSTDFVERHALQQGAQDVARLTQHVDQGTSLLFFAEGTFHRIPGLRPFHIGAFAIAAKCNVPVVPVILRGTRSALRDGSWFPRRGAISVKIRPAIPPDATDLPAAVRLRDVVRAEILQWCGEPDLAERQADVKLR